MRQIVFYVLLITCLLLRPYGSWAREPAAIALPNGPSLPLSVWAVPNPHWVVLGVHGFNDHRQAFAPLAQALQQSGLATVYAYDQRGFGAHAARGNWVGTPMLIADLAAAAQWVKARHPDLPLIVVGESMGAAVVLLASTDPAALPASRLILLAPAVWGLKQMPWYQASWLQFLNIWAPNATFSARYLRTLGIQPTDDPEVLTGLANDPLFIQTTRVASLYGVAGLMDAAFDQPAAFGQPTLIVYGLNDKIIPPSVTCRWLRRLEAAPPQQTRLLQFAVYESGWHMLTRQHDATRVIRDVVQWMQTDAATPESSRLLTLQSATERICQSR